MAQEVNYTHDHSYIALNMEQTNYQLNLRRKRIQLLNQSGINIISMVPENPLLSQYTSTNLQGTGSPMSTKSFIFIKN